MCIRDRIGFQQGCRNVSGVGVKTDVLCIQPIGRQRAVLRGELDAVCAEVILDEQVCGLRAGNVYLTERCAVPRDNEGDSAAVRPDVCCPFAVLGKKMCIRDSYKTAEVVFPKTTRNAEGELRDPQIMYLTCLLYTSRCV